MLHTIHLASISGFPTLIPHFSPNGIAPPVLHSTGWPRPRRRYVDVAAISRYRIRLSPSPPPRYTFAYLPYILPLQVHVQFSPGKQSYFRTELSVYKEICCSHITVGTVCEAANRIRIIRIISFSSNKFINSITVHTRTSTPTAN